MNTGYSHSVGRDKRVRITPLNRQSGVAVMVLLLVLLLAGISWFLGSLNSNARTIQLERSKITHRAMAQVKDALIGFAAANRERGYLPCPANPSMAGTANEGEAMLSCNSDALRIGRVPWRSLGIDDLKDGSGESLWYAVSANFSMDALTINSDVSVPTLSVNGATQYVAIIFSPGSALGPQRRGATVSPCATISGLLREDYCAANYLDTDPATGISNSDADTTFTQIRSDTFNDALLTISHDQFFSTVEKRVLQQVRACLLRYANASSNKTFPWAHKLDPTSAVDPGDKSFSYPDDVGVRIGRVPDSLVNSGFSWGGSDCPLSSSCPVSGSCPPNKNWLKDWRELVFYAVSSEYAPGGAGSGTAGSLTVNITSSVRAVIFLSGPPFSGPPLSQTRSGLPYKNSPSNYLEGKNAANYNAIGPFESKPATVLYNDRTLIVAP